MPAGALTSNRSDDPVRDKENGTLPVPHPGLLMEGAVCSSLYSFPELPRILSSKQQYKPLGTAPNGRVIFWRDQLLFVKGDNRQLLSRPRSYILPGSTGNKRRHRG